MNETSTLSATKSLMAAGDFDDAIEKIGVNGLSILKDVSLIEAGVSLFELTTTVTNDG